MDKPQKETIELLRKIPKVDELLKDARIQEKINLFGRSYVVEIVRNELGKFRNEIFQGKAGELDSKAILEMCCMKLNEGKIGELRRVINGTGVILHTNLGRAVLSKNAVENVTNLASCYSNLEYDLKNGERGSRYTHVEAILKKITGAEASFVVNNNAAAVLLVLNTLCNDKEVIVSRGQLVEIGGSFRIPDVMKLSGAKLVEVGTTNRTHLYDYEQAINENTGAFVKVHTSNYKISGFTEEVELQELFKLSRRYNIPLIEDIGSGVLVDFSKYGLSHEPLVQDSIKKGADIVTFSGDKLLGGPQAGIIIGKKTYIDRMKKNQLARALRIDKLTLAALESTLTSYLREEEAIKEIPTLTMLLTSFDYQRERGENLLAKLMEKTTGFDFGLEEDYAVVGGGAMPAEYIKSPAVKIACENFSADEIEKFLRNYKIPIIVRIKKKEVTINLRTIFDDDFDVIVDAFRDMMEMVR